MRLLIIRHADPDYPNKTITPAGHLEAQALAKRLATQGVDRIYSSPLGRAIDTMRYTADALGMAHTIEEWVQEIGGWSIEQEPLGRCSAWDVHGETVRAKRPLVTHDNWHTQPPFSDPIFRERFEQLQTSSDAFLARHGYVREGGRYRSVNPNRERIAVFCHGGFGLTWLAHLLEIPVPLMWAGFFLPPSSVTTILFDERTEEWAVPRCIGLGDVSHLYQAGLPVQPSGIRANFD